MYNCWQSSPLRVISESKIRTITLETQGAFSPRIKLASIFGERNLKSINFKSHKAVANMKTRNDYMMWSFTRIDSCSTFPGQTHWYARRQCLLQGYAKFCPRSILNSLSSSSTIWHPSQIKPINVWRTQGGFAKTKLFISELRTRYTPSFNWRNTIMAQKPHTST